MLLLLSLRLPQLRRPDESTESVLDPGPQLELNTSSRASVGSVWAECVHGSAMTGCAGFEGSRAEHGRAGRPGFNEGTSIIHK